MHPRPMGRCEVICGSMFSGKTEELIRRLRRAQIAKLPVQVFKHSLDQRVTIEKLHSHSGDTLEALALDSEIRMEEALEEKTRVIGIDEVQFFSQAIIPFIQRLIEQSKHVIVAGLDMDFRGLPFGCMPALMALADSVTKLKAVCISCGDDAHFTQRMVNDKPAAFKDPLILIGAQENYQARCRSCFQIDYKAFLHTTQEAL